MFYNNEMEWIKHFSFTYLFKLVGLTLILNFFSIAYHGIVSPEGARYSPFLDTYFNYIQWIRRILMETANIFSNALGTESYISGSQMMKIGTDIEVEIWLPCLGIGIMSFWTAFIITNSGDWKKKLRWWIGGIFGIYLVNCVRITLFLIALDRNWAQNTALDHHDLFNIAAYILIGLMMYSYTEDKAERIVNTKSIQPAN